MLRGVGWRLTATYAAVALLTATLLPLATSLTPVAGQARWLSLPLAVTVVVALASCAGALLSRRLTRPLQAVTEAARRLAAGHLEQRAYWEGGDELAELATALNDTALALQTRVQELSEERERLAAVLAHMDSGVLLIDSRGRLTVSNPAARRLLGIQDDGVDRSHIEITRNFHLSQAIDQVLASGVAAKGEFTLVHGGERWVDVSLAPFGAVAGRPAGVVVVLHDVTERRRSEQVRSDFVANVSHELRTPVTAILGFTETLLDGAMEERESARTCIGYIDREGRRLSRMVEDLLELVRLEAKQVSLVRRDLDLVHLVRETAARLWATAEAQDVRLTVDLPNHPIGAFLDGDRIEQVLVNLLDNAIKYTPDGGWVTLVLREEPEDEVRLGVIDSGPGLPPGELRRIFERFYRVDKGRSRQTGGTGLGLAIVKQIVEAHGGRVWAESAPGAGAAFYVVLPRWRPELTRRATLGQSESEGHSGGEGDPSGSGED